MSRLPPALRDQLYDWLDMHNAVRNVQKNWSFDIVGFLAEAIICAEDNELACERSGIHDLPGLACMFERLDAHLEIHRTHREVRQAEAGPVVEWFDASSNPHPNYTREGTGL